MCRSWELFRSVTICHPDSSVLLHFLVCEQKESAGSRASASCLLSVHVEQVKVSPKMEWIEASVSARPHCSFMLSFGEVPLILIYFSLNSYSQSGPPSSSVLALPLILRRGLSTNILLCIFYFFNSVSVFCGSTQPQHELLDTGSVPARVAFVFPLPVCLLVREGLFRQCPNNW